MQQPRDLFSTHLPKVAGSNTILHIQSKRLEVPDSPDRVLPTKPPKLMNVDNERKSLDFKETMCLCLMPHLQTAGRVG
jgi:hypothetical protein